MACIVPQCCVHQQVYKDDCQKCYSRLDSKRYYRDSAEHFDAIGRKYIIYIKKERKEKKTMKPRCVILQNTATILYI